MGHTDLDLVTSMIAEFLKLFLPSIFVRYVMIYVAKTAMK